MERINELKLKQDKSVIDEAELYVLNRTSDERREYEITIDNLKSAQGFVKSERAKVAHLRDVEIPRLAKEYNEAISKGRKIAALQTKRTECEKKLEFAEGWLTGKNIETNPDLKPRYAPSDADITIETATLARDTARNLYRNKMQSAFMEKMDDLCKRADEGMKILFSAFEDKWRILQRCSSIMPGFVPPVPNPVQVSGFIASIYRDSAKKLRYQKMCSLFPRAVMAGKHEFERMLREDRNKAEAVHNREYLGRKKSFVSNAVRIFKANNSDADFRSAQMQKNIKETESASAARFLAEHPKKPFIYNPPKYEPVAELENINNLDDFREEVRKASEKAKAKEKADIAAGRAVPKSDKKLDVVDSKDFAKTDKEKAAIKAAQSAPGDKDEFARGLTASDML